MSIKIPPAALEAGARAMAKAGYDFAAIEITDPYTADADYWNHTARAAFLAMIEAWPKGGLHVPVGAGEPRKSFTLPAIILPLTEKPND